MGKGARGSAVRREAEQVGSMPFPIRSRGWPIPVGRIGNPSVKCGRITNPSYNQMRKSFIRGPLVSMSEDSRSLLLRIIRNTNRH